MYISAHFTLDELTHTEVRGIDNSVPPELRANLRATADMLERIRAVMADEKGGDIPILVSSGYRSPGVNSAVGGSPTSDHVKAMAADFKAPGFGTPYQVACFLAQRMDALQIGQVIHEFGRWIHVSIRSPEKFINRAITISSAGTTAGIIEV
jgi:uncharacterized protein YcbK (DUF882 family)